MSVADIWNMPTTEEELIRWGTLHMIVHRDQNTAIFRRFSIVLPEYWLDPPDFETESVWLLNHQTMHNNIDGVLNVAQFNLLEVDWNDPEERIGWIQSHAQLHTQEANALQVFT